jgi:hypothetical protein
MCAHSISVDYISVHLRTQNAHMHSTVSQPNTSMLRARWTLARIPRLLATYEFGTATSAHGSCKPCVVGPRRIAAHFFPHTRPPDTHVQFSLQYTTGPSHFFIPLVLGPLNSLVWYVPSLRYTRGLGWRMHCGVEVTESSTNKQHHLSHPHSKRRSCIPNVSETPGEPLLHL